MIYKKFIQNNFKLILIIVISSILRLVHLGNVPYGFANDEVSYILSGYTIAITNGFDIAGKFLPLSINLDSSMSPVPVYLISIFIKLLGLSPFIARLPFALMGIGTVILVYLLAMELFNKKTIALWSSFVIALAPWHLFVTRGAWDVIPAQLFYLLGFVIFLKKLNKGSVLWSLPFYFLGFFSYHATKVFFAFFVLFTIIFFFKTLIKRRKEFLFLILGFLSIFLIFAFVVKTQSVTRQSELVFTNQDTTKDIVKEIDFQRAKSSAPTFLKEIESNKVISFTDQILTNYLNSFSPNFLFLVGDVQQRFGYGIFFNGVIYLIDLPLILLGVAYLLAKSDLQKKQTDASYHRQIKFGMIVSFVLLAISPTPSAFGAGSGYLIRNFMMVPFLSILSGAGLTFLWSKTDTKKFINRIFRFSILFIYLLFVANFIYHYYYQFNTYGGEFWNRSSRELSEFILSNYEKYDEIIVSTSEDKVFFQYAMVSHANPNDIQIAWKKDWPVKFGKVKFVNSCYKEEELNKLPHNSLYIAHDDCKLNLKVMKKILDPLEPLRTVWNFYEI